MSNIETSDSRREIEVELSRARQQLDLGFRTGGITAAQVNTDLEHTWVFIPDSEEFQSSEVLGKRDDELFPADVAKPTMQLKQDVLDEERPITREIVFKKPDRDRIFQMAAEPMYDEEGRLSGVMHAAVDITDQRHRELQLMVIHRILRHNLRNRITALLGQAEYLETELRSLADLERIDELAPDIDAILQALEDQDTSEAIPDERSEEFHSLRSAVRTLTDVPIADICDIASSVVDVTNDLTLIDKKISRFLTVSRQGTQSKQTTDVVQTLEQLSETYSDQYPGATVRLTGGEGAVIRATPGELKLAVGEVVENSIVHNDADTPEIEVAIGRTEPNRVTVAVADNGPGLPDYEREAVETNEETPLRHGTGVGLWIAKWITNSLGGPLTITNNDPRGTVVTLEFVGPPDTGQA